MLGEARRAKGKMALTTGPEGKQVVITDMVDGWMPRLQQQQPKLPRELLDANQTGPYEGRRRSAHGLPERENYLYPRPLPSNGLQ